MGCELWAVGVGSLGLISFFYGNFCETPRVYSGLLWLMDVADSGVFF